MIPAEFDYLVPSNLQEAVSMLADNGEEAKLLAGGHSLIPIMKFRLARPRYLIDIGRLPDLSYIREEDGAVAVGALTTHHQLETSDLLKSKVPLLPETASVIADVQVRNRGTIGGSLVHGDPAADLPATPLALEAEFRVVGPSGSRSIRVDEFFQGVFATAVGADEILTEVRFPIPGPRTGGAYLKVPNKASHYAIVGVSAMVAVDDDLTCRHARIGLTGLGFKPERATNMERALVGKALDDPAIREAAESAAAGVDAVDDIHASGEYRVHLSKVSARQAVHLASSRAQAA